MTAQELINQFTLNQACDHDEQNDVFSGLSFFCLLEMLSKGAVESKDIFNEIRNVIKDHNYLSLIKSNQSLTMKNVLCHNDTFSLTPHYTKYIKDNDIIIDKVNMKQLYESIQAVNARIAQFTNHLIPMTLNPDDYKESFILTLMNILNFEGEWSNKFPLTNTTEEKFISVQDGNQTESKVKMMKQYAQYFRYYEDEVYQHILLLCNNSFYGMLISLPKNINKALIPSEINKIITKMSRKKIKGLFLPRFEIETEINLKRICESLGIRTMFTESDQLKNLIDDNLVLSSIKQKCVIKVNEEGAKAAAVTYGEIMASCCPPSFVKEEPIYFIADHPFSFQLIDTYNMLILFSGVFYNVTKDLNTKELNTKELNTNKRMKIM